MWLLALTKAGEHPESRKTLRPQAALNSEGNPFKQPESERGKETQAELVGELWGQMVGDVFKTPLNRDQDHRDPTLRSGAPKSGYRLP